MSESQIDDLNRLIQKNQKDRSRIESEIGVSFDRLDTIREKLFPLMEQGRVLFAPVIDRKNSTITGGNITLITERDKQKETISYHFDDTQEAMIAFLSGLQEEADSNNRNKLSRK